MTDKSRDTFTHDEKRNIAVYIGGIMCFKFAFEFLGNSVSLIAQDRYPKSIALTMSTVLTSTYQLTQCLLAITGAQLLAKFRTSHILATSIFVFGLLALFIIIIDASTGGKFHKGDKTPDKYGNWNPSLLFLFYLPMGGCLGIIELIRRVLPRDIVGENPNKLKRMDATVHMFYEVAGTSGAFASAPVIKQAGPAYSLIALPVMFTLASFLWFQIRANPNVKTDVQRSAESTGPKRSIVYLWFYSVRRGAQIVFTERRFIWLAFGYVLPFIFHRFIENVIFPIFAKQVLKEGSLSGILLAGSNLGELLGAFGVLLFTYRVPTPLPWVRFDAIALMTLWVFPFFPISSPNKFVWSIFPLMVVLSFGWAAGDVSLVAYIQSRIHNVNRHSLDEGTSPLGCVMAFLYSSYIIFFMVLSIPLGRVLDAYNTRGRIREGFIYVAGVMISIGAILIFASTFVPKGACAINPKDDPADLLAVDDEEQGKMEEKGPNVVEAIVAM